MKKLVFGLSALLLCVMMASCGDSSTSKDKDGDKDKDEKVEKIKDPLRKLKSLSEDIKKNGNSWTDAKQWIDMEIEYANTVIAFAESAPSKEEIEKYEGTTSDILDAVILCLNNDEVSKAFKEAENTLDKEQKELEKKLESAKKKLEELSKKYKKDNDNYSDDVEAAPATETEAAESAEEQVQKAAEEIAEQVKQATEQMEEAAPDF